jgi:ribulose-5-phosphate 4-epimerase/fuculose-1-phosphate aldolase
VTLGWWARGGAWAAALAGVGAAGAATQGERPSPGLIEDLVAANRVLYAEGVVDGFGHVSVRHDKNPERFMMARSMAPSLVTAEDILEYDLDSRPVDPRGHAVYLERFIHGEIYKRRPDVKAIVHSHSPSVIPFGVTPVELKPIFHMSSFLGTGVPVFEIRTVDAASDMLIRNSELGRALAETLGDKTVVLMRGHGSVAVGDSLPQVVFRAVYTEVNARLQAQAMQLGPVNFLTPEEAAKSLQVNNSVLGRAWELWKRKAMKPE